MTLHLGTLIWAAWLTWLEIATVNAMRPRRVEDHT